MKTQPTIEHAKKFLSTIACGLTWGLGQQKPGEMCVEAAWCFALGLPHGDDPGCVGSAVRQFKIRLNDSGWTSNDARAKGLARLGLAQIGSDTISQKEFAEKLALETIRKIVPIAFRATAEMKGNKKHAASLLSAALGCESAHDLEDGKIKCRDAKTAADAAYAADAAAAAYAAADAAADAYAAAAAYAAADADAAAAAADADAKDKTLSFMAEIAVDILIEMKSPGCEWLHLSPKAA